MLWSAPDVPLNTLHRYLIPPTLNKLKINVVFDFAINVFWNIVMIIYYTLSLAFLIAVFSGSWTVERLFSFFLEGVLTDTLFGGMQWLFFPDAVMAKDKRKRYNVNHSMSFFIKDENYLLITIG